ncbi:hypothetical protein SAMN05444359_1101, partial [Neolewinella agarilytica]
MRRHLLNAAFGRGLFFTLLACLAFSGLNAQAFSASTPAGTAVDIPDSQFDPSAPDLATMASTSVTVSGIGAGATVSDLAVSMKLNHSWVGDVTVYVAAPNGDILPLFSEPGAAGSGSGNGAGDSSNFSEAGPLTFSDAGTTDPETMGGSIAGGEAVCVDDALCDYFVNGDGLGLPAGATGALVTSFADLAAQGDALNGTWTLYAGDAGTGDTGDISGEMMSFTVSGVASADNGGGNDDDPEDCDATNLACITSINLTLNDNCQGLVIPEMVLTGEFGCLDPNSLTIIVMDEDPSNGPIVDGCGTFNYTVTGEGLSGGGGSADGFTGDFAGSNWTVTDNSNDDEQQLASATFTESTLVMSTTGSPFGVGGGTDFELSASIMFSGMSTVSFDYDLNGVDDGFDDAIIVFNFEGDVVEEVLNTDEPASGSATFDVEAGYTLEFRIEDDGLQPIGDILATILTISNFSVEGGAPAAEFTFNNCWGIVNAEDKTPPAVVTTPDDVELLCVDIDGNTLTTLDETVNKCYRVSSATGATVPGSMATALRNRLFAGGSSPLVPTFTDGCTEEIEVCVNDVLVFDEEDPNCNDVVLTRTFTATEIAVCASAAGEENPSVTASYTITFTRPTLDDLNAENVEPVVIVDCSDPRAGGGNDTRPVDPLEVDFPFLQIGDRTFNLNAGEAVCNIGVTYSDGPAIVTCPNTYKYVRTYTVIDWCDPSDVRTFTQIVKVGDFTAPTFTAPTQDLDFDGVADEGPLVFTTNAGNVCAAYIRLDAGGSISDDCGDSPLDIQVVASIYPGGDLSATPIGSFEVNYFDNDAEVTSAIPVGSHILRYSYTDQCGNSDFTDVEFVVEDGTAPVAICEDGLNVSISSGSAAGGASTGIAILTPEMIDAGSYDDCSGVTLEIARVGADNIATEAYDQELVLTCADLGTVRVGLKVTDAEGNMNFCWLDVLVEDKNAPTCIAPGPVEMSCIVARATLPDDIMEA